MNIKRLKEIEAKLQKQKEILIQKYGEGKHLWEINGKITEVQIKILDWEIKQK